MLFYKWGVSEDFNLILWLPAEGREACGPIMAQLVERVIQMAVWIQAPDSDRPHVPVDKTQHCDIKICDTLQLAGT